MTNEVCFPLLGWTQHRYLLCLKTQLNLVNGIRQFPVVAELYGVNNEMCEYNISVYSGWLNWTLDDSITYICFGNDSMYQY